MDGLTEGRMVHYVLPDGIHRPAVIVRVWNADGVSNLRVFTDGANDLNAYGDQITKEFAQQIETGLLWRTSIPYSERKEPNTWHWIEKA